MGDENSNSQPHRKAERPWSVTTCLLYGGAGLLAGVLGYYGHKWIKDSGDSQLNESTTKAYEQHETKHHRGSEAIKRLSGCSRRDAIVSLVRRIEFHFYRNQQISDVTALRSLSSIQSYINKTFNVTPLTDLLRDNPSSLTPAEKHHSFNKIKVLCFSRLLSALYVLLCRLWLHRIEINILGRQWVPQLIKSLEGATVSNEDLKTLQRELDACELAVQRYPATSNRPTTNSSVIKSKDVSSSSNQTNSTLNRMDPDVSSSEFHSSMSESDMSSATQTDSKIETKLKPLFQRSRISQYHPRQKVAVFPPSNSTSLNSEANYVFLTSTRWLEFWPGVAGCPNLVKPIVEEVLADTFPQHLISLTTLQNLFYMMCHKLESQIFGSADHAPIIVDLLLPELFTNMEANTPPASSPSAPVNEGNSIDSLVSETIETPVAEVTKKSASILSGWEDDSGRDDEASRQIYRFDISSLTSEDDKNFVHGCLAETRDILECSGFRCAFVASREALLGKCLELLVEKLPAAVLSGEPFPLCRIFGRLCGVSDGLLVESSEDNDVPDDNNEFSVLFGELLSVENFCGSVYFPSIMCPDLMPTGDT